MSRREAVRSISRAASLCGTLIVASLVAACSSTTPTSTTAPAAAQPGSSLQTGSGGNLATRAPGGGAAGIFNLSTATLGPNAAAAADQFASCLAGAHGAACFANGSASATIGPESITDPAPPTRLAAIVIGSTVTLSWQAPPDPTIAYIIEAGSAPGLANLANFRTPNAGVSYFASGVPAGTYYIRVRAVTTAATSQPSNEVVATVGGGSCVTPGAVVLTLAQNAGGTVGLSWTPAAGTPTSYIVEAGSAPGLSDLANVDLGSVPITVTFQGVPIGTYYVRVRARNACGVGPGSNEVTLRVVSNAPAPTGNNKPVIDSISFPSSISGAIGAFTNGQASISDVDGDMVAAHFRAVSVNGSPFSGGGFDVNFGSAAQGITSGTFGFQIGCLASNTAPCSGTTVMRLTIEDAAHNTSDPKDFTFSYR